MRQAEAILKNSGYEEISLSSLSTSDYGELSELTECMLDYCEPRHISLSLPSLRADSFSAELMQRVQKVRKSGLTFACEAGTQRLRDVINKNITEEEVMKTCRIAFEGGYDTVKLYFMMGLPTETDEDIAGIAELAQKVVDLYYQIAGKGRGKNLQVSISTATFIPKPFTPFEFEPQATYAQIEHKQQVLRDAIRSKKIRASLHQSDASLLEAVLARGDRRVGQVLYRAWKKGCTFDSWDEYFDFSRWQAAFDEAGLDPAFYANRTRPYDEVFPWDHLDYYVSKDFFVRENQRAHQSLTTPNCRQKCAGCGVNLKAGGACFAEDPYSV